MKWAKSSISALHRRFGLLPILVATAANCEMSSDTIESLLRLPCLVMQVAINSVMLTLMPPVMVRHASESRRRLTY